MLSGVKRAAELQIRQRLTIMATARITELSMKDKPHRKKVVWQFPVRSTSQPGDTETEENDNELKKGDIFQHSLDRFQETIKLNNN